MFADVVYLSTEGRFPENRLLEMIETRIAANPELKEHLSGDHVLLKQAVRSLLVSLSVCQLVSLSACHLVSFS